MYKYSHLYGYVLGVNHFGGYHLKNDDQHKIQKYLAPKYVLKHLYFYALKYQEEENTYYSHTAISSEFSTECSKKEECERAYDSPCASSSTIKLVLNQLT